MYALASAGVDQWVAGQKRNQMFRNADRSHAGTASAVRDCKGLVQIQMADICADTARAGQADLRVHVCAVHVHLTAICMNDAGDLGDAFFVYTVGTRVGDHQAGQVILVLLRLVAQIGYVDIPLFVAFHQNDLHAAHRGTGRIGTMRRGGDQRDVAVRIAARSMISLDDQQPGVLAPARRCSAENSSLQSR